MLLAESPYLQASFSAPLGIYRIWNIIMSTHLLCLADHSGCTSITSLRDFGSHAELLGIVAAD